MIKIFITQNPVYHNKVKWVLLIISQYTKIPYEFILEKAQSNISIGTSIENDIQIDIPFFQKIENGQTHWKQILPDGPIYKNESGETCILETIFYLVNCVQELNIDTAETDQWGRFKYTASLQYHYGIVEQNFVADLIDQLIERFPILTDGKGKPSHVSQVFLSHDIDLVHSGWKIESYLAAKKFDWKTLLKVIRDIVLRKPFYNNIDQVIELDKKYDFTSCFYWLAAYGKDTNGIMNADYSIDDLIKMSSQVAAQGFTNGIHKSSFPTTFCEEMNKFSSIIEHNRYHFLKFQTHKAWRMIEASGLKTDASLGFAEHIGFRNSYGLPFVPFDMENDRPFNFLEIPLHVMDVTLFQYMSLNEKETYNRLKSFRLKNKDNCVISILWHNNALAEYTLYESFQTYKYLLFVLEQEKIEYKLPIDLMNEYLPK